MEGGDWVNLGCSRYTELGLELEKNGGIGWDTLQRFQSNRESRLGHPIDLPIVGINCNGCHCCGCFCPMLTLVCLLDDEFSIEERLKWDLKTQLTQRN